MSIDYEMVAGKQQFDIVRTKISLPVDQEGMGKTLTNVGQIFLELFSLAVSYDLRGSKLKFYINKDKKSSKHCDYEAVEA